MGELRYLPGRLRAREATRRLIRETRLSASQLVMPLFVRPGKNVREPIASMPGQCRLSVDQAVKTAQDLRAAGVPAILLFGLPGRNTKDARASAALAKDGIVQQAVRAIKDQVADVLVMTDVCLCAYTDHGHCGVLQGTGGRRQGAGGRKQSARPTPHAPCPTPQSEREVAIDREATLEVLAKIAVSHAQAGADLVAPSDMMDGSVGAIRQALDGTGFERTPIMAYSAKYASSLYAPFREAVDSAPDFGDRRSHQMDIANVEEALRKVAMDIRQGADIVMVKPALGFLDVIWRITQQFHHPVAAFNVSGEYAMVKATASRGWIVERSVWWEQLQCLARAGADLLITYWAKEAARAIRET